VFDIYPHMMFDYRYGDCGVLRQPRFSQMHYALAQMRNLAYTHAKQFGFWFGTFNQRWFKRFMSPEVRAAYWAERETGLTAIAHGANLLISGYNMPEDEKHWASLGEGLRLVQRAGPELLVTRREKAKACFLFPRTQYVQLQEEYWNVGLSFELFLQAFGELDVIHEDQLTDSRIGDYAILTMFDVKLLPDEIARRIDVYARNGGIVIADCVPNLDRYAHPSDVMSRLFGVRDASTDRVKRTGVWVPEVEKPHWFVKPESGEDAFAATTATVKGRAFEREFELTIASPRPATVTDGETLLATNAGPAGLVRRKVGKGRTYLLGFCVQDSYFETFKKEDVHSRDELRALLQCIADDAGVRANVSWSVPDVEAAVRSNEAQAFLFVINHGASDAAATVRIRGAGANAARIEDVADGREVTFRREAGGISLTLDVRHDEPRLFRIRRKR
jgi:hypothetical protein